MRRVHNVTGDFEGCNARRCGWPRCSRPGRRLPTKKADKRECRCATPARAPASCSGASNSCKGPEHCKGQGLDEHEEPKRLAPRRWQKVVTADARSEADAPRPTLPAPGGRSSRVGPGHCAGRKDDGETLPPGLRVRWGGLTRRKRRNASGTHSWAHGVGLRTDHSRR